MIISVPNSLNLSHNSLVSKKQSICKSSSLLHFGFKNLGLSSFFFFLGGSPELGGVEVSWLFMLLCSNADGLFFWSSLSLHCSTSTSSSFSFDFFGDIPALKPGLGSRPKSIYLINNSFLHILLDKSPYVIALPMQMRSVSI